MSRSLGPKKAWFVVLALASIAVLARVVNWFRGGDSASANVPTDADEPSTDIWTEWDETKIKELSEKAHIEHRGNLRIKGSILEGMKITVIDGDVEIDGDLQGKSELIVEKTKKENKVHEGPGSNAYVNNTVRVSGNYNSNVGNVIGVNNSVNIVGFFGFFRWLFGSSVHVNGGTKHTTIKMRGNLLENSKINAENADVDVLDIHSHASIDTNNGSITAKDMLLDAAIKTSNGPIKVSSAGINATIKTSNGKISVTGNVFETAHLKTSNAGISIDGNIGENATFKTSNGAIIAKGNVSKGAILKTSNGMIRIEGTVADDVEFCTSNAEIQLLNDFGKIHVETSNADVLIKEEYAAKAVNLDAEISSQNSIRPTL